MQITMIKSKCFVLISLFVVTSFQLAFAESSPVSNPNKLKALYYKVNPEASPSQPSLDVSGQQITIEEAQRQKLEMFKKFISNFCEKLVDVEAKVIGRKMASLQVEIRQEPLSSKNYDDAVSNLGDLIRIITQFQAKLEMQPFISDEKFGDYYENIKQDFLTRKIKYLVKDDDTTDVIVKYFQETGHRLPPDFGVNGKAFKLQQLELVMKRVELERKSSSLEGQGKKENLKYNNFLNESISYLKDSIDYFDDFYSFEFE